MRPGLRRVLCSMLWATRALVLGVPALSAAQPAASSAALAAPPGPPPARIVSLVPSLTEAVCLLQACARLVGVDRHSNWPSAVQALPRLGGLDDTPLEQLVGLRPDLVLLPPSSRLLPRLQELGIPALALPTQTHADVQQALRTIGQRLGRPELAERLWAEAQAQIQAAAHGLPAAARGRRVYVEVSSEPHAAGPASFIGQTLQQLGLRNIAPEDASPFPRLNPEFVVRAQPEVIVAPRHQFERMRSRPGWGRLAALDIDACSLPPERWEVLVRPGPRLGTAAQILADCLSRVPAARP